MEKALFLGFHTRWDYQERSQSEDRPALRKEELKSRP